MKLAAQIKRVININKKLKNLINHEYAPLAEEFFTSHAFNFACDQSALESNANNDKDDQKHDYVDKIDDDIELWQGKLNA